MAAHAHSIISYNLKLSRRACLGGVAAVVTFGGMASAGTVSTSTLAELIADYNFKRREAEVLLAEFAALRQKTNLPKVEVRFGRCRVRNEETGEITWTQWRATTPDELRRHYMPLDWMPAAPRTRISAEYEAAIARLEQAQRAHDEVWEASGLGAAERACEASRDARLHARQAIFRFRPATIADVETKNAFLVDLLEQGFQFSGDNLAAIFGGTVTDKLPGLSAAGQVTAA